ncbi:cholesterol oxidase substrate-binding domain-containing protein [Rhodococcus sp. Q]|uniref:cholesterol oxidase substrate-binding domain-containing protein n=1 Tax=Rhodococcus sp. Q TaxID=2502252 RepID=UPI0010F503E8|nr:cholesterol oxidase substrate-binding domain-containing protein [Rhodococcus sp. Q]
MTAQELSRRGFLAAAAAGAAALTTLGWTPAHALPSSDARVTLPPLPAFPEGIPLSQQGYENWVKEIVFDEVWTCAPATAEDVVRVANWAHTNGYRLRPRGTMHGWSPLTLVPGQNVDKVLLVDTLSHLNHVVVNQSVEPGRSTVTAGGGAMLMAVLTELEKHGLGWANSPAIGELSIAGILAIDAHGATLPADGETVLPGASFGSISNLVTKLTAVVWDTGRGEYVLREFTRADPGIRPLLTHLGRTFVTEVTLQAGPNYRLRCQSSTDIPWRELFAPAGSAGRTFESFVAKSGRVEAIWFPFTDTPYLKVWTPTPTKPSKSREVTGPYNYPYSDNLPKPVTDLLGQIVNGAGALTPLFGQTQLATFKAGLAATNGADLWGWSKDVQFYLRATTLRMTAGGGVVITKRSNIARVINEFVTWHNKRQQELKAKGKYPINGPFEVRLCGLDDQSEVTVETAGPPTISALRPRPDHPEWDTAIWMNVVGVPGTPGMAAYFREMERFMRANYSGDYATFRPEWAKGWAFTDQAAFVDAETIGTVIPQTYRAGVPSGDNWDSAGAAFNAYDPHRIFTNPLLDRLLP